jgi:hypothetical protein
MAPRRSRVLLGLAVAALLVGLFLSELLRARPTAPARETTAGAASGASAPAERDVPTRLPITVAPPSAWISWVEMAAEWIAGMISTLAGPDKRMKGKLTRASGIKASSGGISPSYSKSMSGISSSRATASRTRSARSPIGLPKVE